MTIGDERIDVPGAPSSAIALVGCAELVAAASGWVCRCSGRLDDGTWWHSARSIVPKIDIFQTGYVVTPDMTLTPVDKVHVAYEARRRNSTVEGRAGRRGRHE